MKTLRRLGWATIALTMVGLLAATAASATTTQTYVPFADPDVINPCNGDIVAVTGTMHLVAVSNDNKAEIQINWPDTTGVAVDGTRYQANDTTHTYLVTTGPNAFTFTFHDSYELISQDNTSNFLVHEDVTINLLTMEASLQRGGAECSGPTPAPPPPV